jgi:hypothetical protein
MLLQGMDWDDWRQLDSGSTADVRGLNDGFHGITHLSADVSEA